MSTTREAGEAWIDTSGTTTVADIAQAVLDHTQKEKAPMSDIKYEPTREHWTPYQPWMRDLLADDARVSALSMFLGGESRVTWQDSHGDDAWFVRRDLRIHPDDCPERPAEDDPCVCLSEEPCRVHDNPDLESVVRAQLDGHGVECHGAVRITSARIARAAREHIEDSLKVYYRDLYEKAEAERDEWEASFHRAEDEVGTLAVEVGNWKHVANVRGKREVWLSEERNHWKARHAALVADIEAVRVRWHERYMAMPDGHTAKRYAEVIEDFSDDLNRTIARDDERGQA